MEGGREREKLRTNECYWKIVFFVPARDLRFYYWKENCDDKDNIDVFQIVIKRQRERDEKGEGSFIYALEREGILLITWNDARWTDADVLEQFQSSLE